MKKTITGLVLGVLLIGIFVFTYVQSDGMYLLPFEGHTSGGFNKLFAILSLIFFLWLFIRSIVSLSKNQKISKAFIILIATIFAAIYVYMAISTVSIFFCNN